MLTISSGAQRRERNSKKWKKVGKGEMSEQLEAACTPPIQSP